MTPQDFMLEIISGWRRKFTPDELTMLAEQLKQLIKLSKDQQAANAELVRTLQSEIKRYDKAIDVLQSQLESRADEIEGLKTQNEALQAENRDLLNFRDA